MGTELSEMGTEMSEVGAEMSKVGAEMIEILNLNVGLSAIVFSPPVRCLSAGLRFSGYNCGSTYTYSTHAQVIFTQTFKYCV